MRAYQRVDVKHLSNTRNEHLKPYFEQGAKFHSWLSPGLVLGIIMVDLAKELLGHGKLIDAVVETKACIPDAVQLMTACTYGNGWMRVKDWGKMAVTLYDKEKLDGIRVFANLEGIKRHPLIYRWYMKSDDVDQEKVAKDIMLAGRDILSWERVKVIPYRKQRKAPTAICSSCGETYPAGDGYLCIRCSGKENYYQVIDKDAEESLTQDNQ